MDAIKRQDNRNIGVELLRIVAMLMIVLLHLICHTFSDTSETKTPAANVMSYHSIRALSRIISVVCSAIVP